MLTVPTFIFIQRWQDVVVFADFEVDLLTNAFWDCTFRNDYTDTYKSKY